MEEETNDPLFDEILASDEDIKEVGAEEKPKKETPPEDDLTEETPPQEDTPPEESDPPKEDTPPEEEKKEDLTFFNSLYGKKFTSQDEVVAEHENITKQLTTAQEELVALKTTNEELKSKVDPLSFFASEDEYKRQQLLMKFPEYDPTVLTKVVTSDLKEMKPEDIVRLNIQLQNADILSSQDDIDIVMEEKYGLEPGMKFSELARKDQLKIEMEAKSIRSEFLKLKSGVELPEKLDLEKARTESYEKGKQAWEPFVKKDLINSLDKVSFDFKAKDGKKETFDFEIDKQYKQFITQKLDLVVDDLAKKGGDVSEEAKQSIIQGYKNLYIRNNMTSIMDAYANSKIKQLSEKEFQELHNPKPLKSSEPPVKKTSQEQQWEQADEEIEKEL